MREDFPLFIYQRDSEGRLPWDRANRKPRRRSGTTLDTAAASAELVDEGTAAAEPAAATIALGGGTAAAAAAPEQAAPLPRGGPEVASREITLHLPRPHGAQQQIIEESGKLGIRFNVLCCGRRFGKSTLGTDRLIEPAVMGYPVAWFSPTYKMLTETWRDLKRALSPVVLKTSEQEHRLELLGGGVVECWSLEMPDAARGRRYKRIVLDEAAQVRNLDGIWKQVLRATLTDYRGEAWFLSTPRGLNDFHTLYQQGQSPEWPEWRSWRMPTSLNPYISLSEIESARHDLGPLAFAQEYEADFTALGDVAFPEFRPSVLDNATGQPIPHHVIPTDYSLIRGWRRVAGHDYGYASPSATLWLAIDPAGGAVAYREFSCRRLHVDEVAASVLYRQGDERVVIYGDPSLFRMHGSAFLTSEMIADLSRAGKDDLTVGRQYRDAGMEMQPANNARIPGKLRLHTLLSPRPSDGVPYLRFMDCCPDTIATLQSLQLDPDRPEDVRTDFPSSDEVWQRDEFYDCLRYALMGIPSRVTRTPEERRGGLLSRAEGGAGGGSRQYEWGAPSLGAGQRGGWR